jgi:predicted O-methyltransferase YrrM
VTDQNLISRWAMAFWQRRNPDWAVAHPDRESPHLELGVGSLARYGLDQARLAVDRRVHGVEGQPWITADSKALLHTLLRPTDRGIEFGSGGSTEWLAAHVGEVYAVEAFARWHGPLAERLARDRVTNVELALASAEDLGYESEAHRDAYINAHQDLQPESLDFVFVDGEYRDDTALRGIKLLRSGGLLVLDNANSYLPNPTRTPWRVDRPVSAKWETFLDEVKGWRYLWTTNGAWDTALWIKP